jgi:hypothetical protein
MEMCKTLLGFAHFHRHGGDEPTNNKTGHFTCYKNRTFSFATDRLSFRQTFFSIKDLFAAQVAAQLRRDGAAKREPDRASIKKSAGVVLINR